MNLFKMRTFIAISIIVLTLSGCGGGGGSTASTVTENVQSETTVLASQVVESTTEENILETSIPETTNSGAVEPTPALEPETIMESTPLPAVVDPTPEPTIEPETELIIEPTPSNEAIEPTSETTPICESGSAMHQGKVTDSSTGEGLANTVVTIDGCSTSTDSNGFYTLSNIIEKTSAVVKFSKEGYLTGSAYIQIKSSSNESTLTNYLEYGMYAHDYKYNYTSGEDISSSRIHIDASVTYKNTDNNIYKSSKLVKLTILDNDEESLLSAFPGSFQGINDNGVLVQFETYGLISIAIEDSSGNLLDFSDGETGTLIFNKVSVPQKQNTLPLWYYDYDQGLWFEEGYAQLQEDGTYKGEISHLGTWSLNKPLENEPGIYKGRIIDENGDPMSYVRLQATGDNWISRDLSTDEYGNFEIEVIPGSNFRLGAYNYKDKYEASYSEMIAPIASGVIVEN